MIREEFYTEIEVEVFAKLSVDTESKAYELINNLSAEEIDMEMVDFLAPKVFEALIVGLDTQGYKKL
ncbi:MAG: hypothetical protein IJA65_03840 [Acholeplasmatales bacterium]|nr:hypothetical protein [Acholeplasmatales bacterium]